MNALEKDPDDVTETEEETLLDDDELEESEDDDDEFEDLGEDESEED